MMASLLEQLQAQKQAAKAANLKRYEQAMAIYDEIISRYRPGGEFGRAALGQLEKRKIRDVGKETQQLISSGLYGTTTMAATGRRWEESVGGPERLKLEDIQMQRLSEAQIGKAGFIERREDIGPDYGMIAQLASQVGAAPQRTVTREYGRTYGASSFPDMFSIAGRAPTRYTGKTITGGGLQPTAEMFRKPTTTAPVSAQVAAPTPTAEDDTAAYQGWAAEMKRRYPNKPVMPQSRWRRLVKPKMGATYGQFAGGTYGQA
jgi:hypothetical protein